MKYRNSDLYRATKTVAFLPVIDCKDGVSPPTWLSAFRVAVFHHCLSLILNPFKSDNEKYTLSYDIYLLDILSVIIIFTDSICLVVYCIS